VECHGASATQTVSQQGATTQSSTASGHDSFMGWLSEFAASVGATVQTIFQEQLADCVQHCTGGSQVQQALQEAHVSQTSLAGGEPARTVPAAPAPGSAPPEAEVAATQLTQRVRIRGRRVRSRANRVRFSNRERLKSQRGSD
jgi:hypothetical protein